MASNPMQRKARNSFILGILIATLICAIVIAFMLMKLKDKEETIKKLQSNQVEVLALKDAKKAGDPITQDDFTTLKVNKNSIPGNALKDSDSILFPDLKASNPDLDITYEDYKFQVSPKDSSQKFNVEIDENGKYYYNDGQNVHEIIISQQPMIAKINLDANTIITEEFVMQDQLKDNVRDYQITGISLPVTIEENDFVDVRILYPNGSDLIVLSKKRVSFPIVDEHESLDIINLQLTEDEILMYLSAQIDQYMITGAKLYATRYIEPGLQVASTTTYSPSYETLTLVQNDANISKEAYETIFKFMNTENSENGGAYIRTKLINPMIEALYEKEVDKLNAVGSKITEEVRNMSDQRSKYLKSLPEIDVTETLED